MNSNAKASEIDKDYTSLIDALPYATALIRYNSISFSIQYANQEYIHTYLENSEHLNANSFFEYFYDERGVLEKSFKKVISSGKQDSIEVKKYGPKSGSIEYKRVRVNNSMFRGRDEFIYLLHIVSSVSDDKTKDNKHVDLHLKQAEEMASFGTWELNLNTNEIFWSDGVYAICGYNRDEFKLTFDSALEVIHPEDRGRAIREMQRVIKDGGTYSIRKRLIAKGKRVRQVLSKGKLILDSKGEPEKLVGVFLDITERLLYEQVELKLTDSQKKFQDLFKEAQQVAEIGAWELDLSNNTLYWSERTKKIHEVEENYTPSVDDAIEFYLEGEDRAKIQMAVGATMKNGEPYDLELQIITAKGNQKWIRTTGRAEIFNKKPVRIYGAIQDITSKKEFEISLHDSKEKYQALVESVNGILWEAEADTFKFNYVSEKSTEILGYSPEDWLADPSFWSRNMHPDDRNDAVSYCKKMTEKELDHNFEYRMISKSGDTVWIRDYVTVVKQPGKANILRGIMLDITELKSAENIVSDALYELKNRNQFIETALENLPIGIAVNKIDSGEAELMNRKFSEIYGWPEEDFKDVNTFFELIYPDPEYRAEMAKRIVDDIASGDPNRMQWNEVMITKKSGDQGFVNAKNIPLYDQNLMISTVIDVTGQVEKKRKLEQLSLVASKTSEVVIILDSLGQIVWVNETFEKVSGYMLDEVIGKIPGKILSGPETDPVTEKRLLNVVKNGESIQTEIINYSKTGKKYWVDVRIDPVLNEDGECTAFVVIGTNITKRKKKDQQILQSLREKEVLLSEIHHRVKNNLAVVSSMMQIQMHKEDDELVVSKLIDSIYRIKTMATIHELLYQSDSFSELKFSEIIELLIQSIREVLSSDKDIRFEIDHDNVDLNINQAIPCSLIMNEVITNIFKHAFIDQESGLVTISFKMDDDKIHLKIADNGKGLPSDFDFKSSTSLGTNLINILTKQIEGKCSYRNVKKGVVFELEFEKKDLPGIGSAKIN